MWISSVVNFSIRSLEFSALHKITKSSIVIILAVIFSLQVKIIKELFNSKITIIYGLFVATEPYLIGIDRWFHVTSLEASLAFLSLLLLMMWRRFSLKRYLIFSSIALSLAIMSKTTPIIFLPIFILFAALGGSSSLTLSPRMVKAVLIYLFTFTLVSITIFPALWAAPLYVFNKLFTAAFTATLNTDRLTPFGNFYYLVILAFRLSPISLFLFIFSLTKLPKRLHSSDVVILTMYLLVYLIFLSLASQKIDRYILPVIFPLLLLVSIYVSGFNIKKILMVFLAALVFNLWFIKTYYPVYSAYYSPIFGGSAKALELGIYDNSGAYFAQAAEYLNTKGRDIDVTIPENMDSFSAFFGGRFSKWYSPDTDYIVKSQDFDRKIDGDEVCPIVDKTFGPGDFKAVYVFKCRR